MFVIGTIPSQSKARSRRRSISQQPDMPRLSSQVTIGRNSQFQNLTKEDREALGGMEYRALKLLFKIVVGMSHVSILSSRRNALICRRLLRRPPCFRRNRSRWLDTYV